MQSYYLEIRHGDISAVYNNGEFVNAYVTKCGESKEYKNEDDFLDYLDYLGITINDVKEGTGMKENYIYTSSNYDDFVFRTANRDVDIPHINKIAENMKVNGWQGAPIEVSLTDDKKFQIEDGQHRFMACKKSNTPVKFMIVKKMSIYDVATKNSMKKGWKGSDYIKAYSEDGNFNYKRLKNLQDEFPKVSLSDILDVVVGKHTQNNLKKGYIHINDEQYYKAREVLKSLTIMNESLKLIGIKTMSSYKKILVDLLLNDVIDPQRMIDKLDKHGRMLLPPSATKDQAIQYLEALYNYHQRDKTTVMFREQLKGRRK